MKILSLTSAFYHIGQPSKLAHATLCKSFKLMQLKAHSHLSAFTDSRCGHSDVCIQNSPVQNEYQVHGLKTPVSALHLLLYFLLAQVPLPAAKETGSSSSTCALPAAGGPAMTDSTH